MKKETALEILKNRCLAEPYNFYLIDPLIEPNMLDAGNTATRVILECQRQYRASGLYSPQSVGVSLSDNTTIDSSMKDAEIDLQSAFDLYFQIHCTWVECHIAAGVESLAATGKTADEIQAKANEQRQFYGAIPRTVGGDGKDEFSAELIGALDGVVKEYPIQPHLEKMQKIHAYHEPGEYVVVQGLTGCGKTYYALNAAIHNAKRGAPFLVVNIENTPKNIYKRLWQMYAGIKFSRDMRGVDAGKAIESWEAVKKLPIHVINPGNKLSEILSAIRYHRQKYGIQAVAVDYVQLMSIPGYRGGRNYELGEISLQLRGLALSEGIPVIALAQLKQEISKTPSKRGGIFGTKDCANFAQDASSVFELFRPESLDEISCDEDGNEYPEKYADVTIYKGRDTGIARIKCRFDEVRGFYEQDLDFAGIGYSAPVFNGARTENEYLPF